MKPLHQSISSCFKKSRYPSEQVALKYKKKAEQARGDQLRVYHCSVCLGFHMTKVEFKPEYRKDTTNGRQTVQNPGRN